MSPLEKKMRCRYVHSVEFEISSDNYHFLNQLIKQIMYLRFKYGYNFIFGNTPFHKTPQIRGFQNTRVFSSGKTFSPSLDIREVWQIQIRILSSSNIMDYISKIQESGYREELGDVNSLPKVRLRILGDF